MSLKKVLHIRSSFDPGGTESLLLNLFNYKQDKLQIFLVLIKKGTLIDQLNNKKNHFFCFYRKCFLDINVILKIKKILRENKISIIHTHQEIELIYAVLIKTFIPKIKIYHSVHLFNHKFNIDYYLERFLIIFTDKILTVSDSLRYFLKNKGYPIKKLITLHNAVAISSINNKFIKDFKKQYKITDNDFVIIMIGNFRPEKDHLTLIKAFNLLRNNYENLKLIFIGRESIETNLCRQITYQEDLNNRVFYINPIKNAFNLLKLCNLFVFSSKSETFGIVVIEALLMQVPVLASDIEVMRELSQNGKYFSLFKTGDENDLADKIQWFINNKNSSEIYNRVQNAYNYAHITFSYDKYIERLEEIYNA